MSFELRDHTADVAVEATAPSLGGVFAAAADGLAAAMCEEIPAAGGERFDLGVRAESREALLFDYLDELIYQRDVRGVLPVDNEVEVREIDGTGPEQNVGTDGEKADGSSGEKDSEGDGGRDGEWVATGSARGVPLAGLGAREVKAVTYSEMALAETDDGWRAYVVFDV
jgi:SHS2 domain-containing protein